MNFPAEGEQLTRNARNSDIAGISGDPTKQAINALRGYAYQIYVSAIAWLELQDDQELHLEVAEDYAIATNDALNAVQVKDTAASGSITLGSPNTGALLDSLFELRARNPRRRVSVRLLTTADIGLEKRKSMRVAGGEALTYWRKAAAGADVSPLKKALSHLQFNQAAKDEIAAMPDEEFRREVLKCVHWECGKPPLAAVQAELDNVMVAYCWDHSKLPPSEAKRLAPAIIEHVLMTCTQAGPRQLSRAALLELIEANTRLSVSRSDAETLLSARSSPSPIFVDRHLLPEAELMLPTNLASRLELASQIGLSTRMNGVVPLIGSTGMGKTIAARLALKSIGGAWSVLDLRDLDPSVASAKLLGAISELSSSKLRGVLIDDANQIDDPVVTRALAAFLNATQRRDLLCIVTLYRKPSIRALSELNISPKSVIEIPKLNLEEVGELVTLAGGDNAEWGTIIHSVSDGGHPQLVQAIIIGHQSRGWLQTELEALRSSGGQQSDDIRQEKGATRSLLVKSVPEVSRTMLYRLSLALSSFNRKSALKLGKIDPAIHQPGEAFDPLIGPWVDEIGENKFRVSPLLYGAGNEVLDEDDVAAVHSILADDIMATDEISVTEANSAYLHAIVGKSELSLVKFANSINTADPETRLQISKYLIALRITRTDRPIFPQNPTVSKLLRLAQLLVCLDFGKDGEVKKVWDALWNERHAQSDEDDTKFEALIITKLLLSNRASKAIPEWFELLLRLYELGQSDEAMAGAVEAMNNSIQLQSAPEMFGVLFISQAMQIGDTEGLGELFRMLDGIDPTLRDKFLYQYNRVPSDFGLLVNSSWAGAHSDGSLDSLAAVGHFREMAIWATSWGYPALAATCEIAVAIMQDEYLGNPDQALQTLENGAKQLGQDDLFKRARAKVLYRQNDYAGALKEAEALDSDFAKNGDIERAFFCRETGICAAFTDAWGKANKWFLEGEQAALNVPSGRMLPMVIGLKADAAFAAYNMGDTASAIDELAQCLEKLEELPPQSSLRATHCYKTIGQMILWFNNEATSDYTRMTDVMYDLPPGMCSNPEPHEGIKDLPRGHIDTLWYMLADTETRFHLDRGINKKLGVRLGQERIPMMELSLRRSRVIAAIERQDDDAFTCALRAWIDFRSYCLDNREEFFETDLENPDRRQMPVANIEHLRNPVVRDTAEEALCAYCFVKILDGEPGDFSKFQSFWTESFPTDYPGHELIHAIGMPTDSAVPDRLEFAKLLGLVRTDDPLSLPKLFMTTLRFTEIAARSDFKDVFIKAIDEWACEAWMNAIKTQRFHIVSPSTTIPPIEEAMRRETGLRRTAAICVEAQQAIGQTLSGEFVEFLVALD